MLESLRLYHLKRTARLAGLVWLCAALPAPAHAEDMREKFGVGAESPLALNSGVLDDFNDIPIRLPGASLRYQLTRGFGLQLLFNARFGDESRESADESISSTLLGVALRGHISPLTQGPVHLGIVVGLGYATQSIDNEFDGFEETRTQVGFEVGLRPEWFVTEWLSLHTQVGLAYTIHGTDAGSDRSATTFGFGRATDLLGNAGITFWLGGGPAASSSGSPEPQEQGDTDRGDAEDEDGWNYGADY